MFSLLDAITETHDPQKLREMDERVHLALEERDFPRSLQVYITRHKKKLRYNFKLEDITIHLMYHMVDGIRRFDPVYGTWMFAYGFFNSWLCKRALNRYRPEATIMKTYRVLHTKYM